LAERRNYKHVFDAFSRIVKEEGITSCWNGATPTMARAISLNMAMMVTYEESKERLTKLMAPGTNVRLIQFYASMLSAIATSVCSLPFDNLKTKLQKQKRLPDGTLPYNGFVDCLLKSIRNEGPLGLWTGLPTYYFRVGPHAMITLLASEFLRKMMF
jgi:solute carrier family 25 oxoglutarate transporter 11